MSRITSATNSITHKNSVANGRLENHRCKDRRDCAKRCSVSSIRGKPDTSANLEPVNRRVSCSSGGISCEFDRMRLAHDLLSLHTIQSNQTL